MTNPEITYTRFDRLSIRVTGFIDAHPVLMAVALWVAIAATSALAWI